MKIQTIRLNNFRAFPGPAPAEFELNGKNLLVYGENGSGKSSLFKSMSGLFRLGPSLDISSLKNSLSGENGGDARVKVESDGDRGVTWKDATRVTDPLAFKSDCIAISNMAAMLDYRSLLATNYKHGDNSINLFELAVTGLLADFLDVASNKTLGKLWKAVLDSKPVRNTARLQTECLAACSAFNNAMQRALALLSQQVNQLMPSLSASGIEIAEFTFTPVSYNFAKQFSLKGFTNQFIGLKLKYRGVEVERPQHYLNEARLSALGLALFLGARLACVPANASALKLMVLDDVLVGIDHSNRLPLLDVLTTSFSAWQIVLLTHDRGWFDLARERLGDAWACYEIYEGDAAAAAPAPIVRKTENRPARALLAKGRELLALGYVEAAANYTRQAFEHGLRGGCEVQRIKLNYKINPKDHQAQDLLDAIKNAPKPAPVPQADWAACLQNIELFKNVVMNPYSHPSAPNIPRQEVDGAANAVEKFLELAGKR